MKYLTNEEMQEILEISKNIAHKGILFPIQTWFIGSDEWEEINRDYKQFFDYATQYK